MNVRIISGKFGGRYIDAPDGPVTHPMSERVRGSLFNIIADKLESAKVLDMFSGGGSLGIEAISRGASHVTFVERDKLASKILSENIKLLGIEAKATAVKIGARTWLEKNQVEYFDIIFADPPYNDMQLSTVSDIGGILKSNGLMVLSYPGRGELPSVNGVVVVDNRIYGTAALAIYQKK